MENFDFRMSVPERGSYDIIVAGGGCAGVAASLSAARRGKKVLLLEKYNMLGGLATIGLVNYFVPMCNGRGTQIIRGMAEELLRESVKYGYDTIPECWKNGTANEKTERYMTCYSPYIFGLQLTELLSDAGVKILFDCNAMHPVMDGGKCVGIITDSKTGLELYRGKMIIDTTGDADILRRASVPTVQGKNYFSYFGRQITVESCRVAAETGKAYKAIMNISGGNATLYGDNHPEGMEYFKGTNVEDISDYYIKNHRLMLEKLKKDERFSREVTTVPSMHNFRTTCHIDGDYTLREEDKYKHFDDSVGAICDFDNRNYLYEVPFRTLIRSGFENIITAGRSASATGYAWDVLRVIPPAIITGQAAGEASCVALDDGKEIYNIDVKKLQSNLEKKDVMIHFDDSLVK